MVIPERTGHLPGLEGRLNPMTSTASTACISAPQTSPSTKAGSSPVHFKLGEPLRLTDVRGAEWLVRFVEMTGNSSVLEYEPPPPRPR